MCFADHRKHRSRWGYACKSNDRSSGYHRVGLEKQLFMRLNIKIIIALLLSVPASAQWKFAARYGGNIAGFSDAVNTMCTDVAGNIYVAGRFNSTINFGNGTAALVATAGGGQTEGFVAKFNAAGLCQWAMDFGGSSSDLGAQGIITDGTTVYVTGQANFPCMIGSFGPLNQMNGDAGPDPDGIVFALSAATGATI